MADDNGFLLQRAVALIVDSILLGIVGAVLAGGLTAVAFSGSNATGMLGGLLAPVFGLLSLIYFVALEARDGQTLGKKLMNIRVVNDDGTPLDLVDSLVRNVLRIVDALPTLYIVGIIAILVTEKGQRVGDLAAGTVVRKA